MSDPPHERSGSDAWPVLTAGPSPKRQIGSCTRTKILASFLLTAAFAETGPEGGANGATKILGGLGQVGIEMAQPRQHLVLQQPQRIVPGFRLVLVVEAEDTKCAEAADLMPDPL